MTALRVLRVYHSGVVEAWRQRDRELQALGCATVLVSAERWNEGGRDVWLRRGDDDFVVPARTWGRHPYRFVYDPLPIVHAMRRHRFDIIDVHEEPASLAAFELRMHASVLQTGVPIVFYGAQNIEKRYPIPFRWIERHSLRRAVGAHCCNTEAGEILQRKGLRGVVRVVGLGVDVERFAPAPAHENDDRFVLGYVGRLERHKGVDILLDAIDSLERVALEIHGEGPERGPLEAQAHRLGLGTRARFHGFATHSELPDIYRGFDALAVPSRRTDRWVEQFGRVAVEGMASGLPVIGSANGRELPEVIGDAGVLVQSERAAEWRTAIRKLASDSVERTRLGRNARARAQRWSWPAVASAHRDFYVDALGDESAVTQTRLGTTR